MYIRFETWQQRTLAATSIATACMRFQAPEVAPAAPVEKPAEIPAEDPTPAIAPRYDQVWPPPCVLSALQMEALERMRLRSDEHIDSRSFARSSFAVAIRGNCFVGN